MKQSKGNKYPCPCCGYLTLSEEPGGSYEICPVCWWEDDNVQYNNPDFMGGANKVSLRIAQDNFKKFGAISKESLKYVRRPHEKESPNYRTQS